MKLCIPVKFPDGLDSAVEPHLPQAEHLLFFDTETRSTQTISLRQPKPGDELHMDFQAVLCGSISGATLRALSLQGVEVYGTTAVTVAQAVAQFESGELVAADAGAGQCAGHGSGACGGGCGGGCHEHHHEHDGEEGHAPGTCDGQGGCGGHGACGNHAHDDHEHGHAHEHGGGHGGCGCGGHGHAQQQPNYKPLGEVFTLAVCSQNRKTVTEHAGKCRKFWMYEIRQGAVVGRTLLELPLEQALHAAPVDQPHPLDSVHALIAAGMGDGLRHRLAQRGIRGLVTDLTDPDEVVALFLERALGVARAATTA